MHVHGRAGKPKQLARYAKNPGKTFGFAAERTGTELFDVFPVFLKSSRGTERMLSQTTKPITDRGGNIMMELQVLALAVARLFGLTPFGGDAVRHRCDEYRYPAGRQADPSPKSHPKKAGPRLVQAFL